jgi:hypothetical protein
MMYATPELWLVNDARLAILDSEPDGPIDSVSELEEGGQPKGQLIGLD